MKDTLKSAVIEQLGYESENDQELIDTCKDITNYGITGGFGQFIYYADTCSFFDANKSDIMELCAEYSQEFGESISEMISWFGCVNCTEQEVDLWLCGCDEENEVELKNALAWFAAETVAQIIVEKA